jgi:hypothetical protein
MPDNPNLTGQDRSTVSNQPHEIQYLATALEKEFPDIAPENIRGAILSVKKEVGPEREAVLREARKALSSMEHVINNEDSAGN